jgi:hypothetical protein
VLGSQDVRRRPGHRAPKRERSGPSNGPVARRGGASPSGRGGRHADSSAGSAGSQVGLSRSDWEG